MGQRHSQRRPRKRAEVRGVVESLDRHARGVMTHEGVRIAVPGALPDEHVCVRADLGRSSPVGTLIDVDQPSAERVKPACPLFDRCGGCSTMHMSESSQRELKLGWVQRAALPHLEVQWHSSAPTGVRRRARLAWSPSGGTAGRLGYRVQHSNQVVDVDRCVVLTDPLNHALHAVRELVLPVLTHSGELSFAECADHRVVVSLQAEHDSAPEVFRACETLATHDVIAGVTLKHPGSGPSAARWGIAEQSIQLDATTKLTAPANSFTQAHNKLNIDMVRTVVELAELHDTANQRVLELFCGIGNFTVPLARQAASLDGVEFDAASVEACRANLARYGLDKHTSIRVGDANTPILQTKRTYDVVVLDPPRIGAEGAVQAIANGELRPKRIVYVSCEPRTLERDVRTLAAGGYQVDAAHAFDAFGPSAHVEAIVRLRQIRR